MLVEDEEREVVDQPSKGLPVVPTIIIFGSTHTETLDPHPAEGMLLRTGVDDDDDDDDADVDFGNLSAFDEILSANFAIPDKEITTASGSEVQKSLGKLSSSTLTHATPPTLVLAVKVPAKLLSSISTLLNHPLSALVADSETKQSLLKSISSLSKVAQPASVQPLYQSFCCFMEDLLEQVPKVDAAEASFSYASQQLEAFDQELESSMKAKDLASTKLAAGEAKVQDIAKEIALAEERLRILKEKKNILDQAIG